jgi:hypothetical protein
LRSAFDSFFLYARVIFPPLPVHGLVELLGDMEPVHHCFGILQQLPTGGVEGRAHVGPVRLHLPPLLRRQLLQTLLARRLIAPLGHRQHLGPVGVGQVGQDRDVQLVPLLQAQLVDPDVMDHPLGIDLLGLGVGQLVADDQADRLGGNAQPPRDFLLIAPDERSQHLLLEAVGVAGVFAFEGRDQVLAVVAPGAAVEDGLVDPEAGLAPEVQVAYDLDGVLDLQVGVVFLAAGIATTAGGPGPGDFEAVSFAVALVGGEGDARRQIDVDGDRGHGRT